MKNSNKINSIYTYPSKVRGQRAVEVGFFIDSRKDKYGNVLRKINAVNPYGEVSQIPYSGKTLMISICTDLKTTVVKKATREDLGRFKEAYNSYLLDLDIEDRKEHEGKLYNLLDEVPKETDQVEKVKPVKEKKSQQ